MILNWNFSKNGLPEKSGEYATAVETLYGDSYLTTMNFATGEDGGWNCHINPVTGEMCNKQRLTGIYAWAELAPFRAMVQKELDELNAMMKEKKR